MAKRAAGVISDGDAADQKQARTEVLAKAFHEATGGYFERMANFEEQIATAESNKQTARNYAVAGIIAGVVIFFFGLISEVPPISIIGLIVAAGVGWYQYNKYTTAEEVIEENKQKLADNKPDGSVSFVAQIGVPIHLVQYSDRHMIFDGLNNAPPTDLELAHIDSDELLNQESELQDVTDAFESNLEGEQVLDPELAERFSPGVSEHRQLEKPITDRIDQMTAVARGVETDNVRVNVHANNEKSRSVERLYKNDLVDTSNNLPLVKTKQSMGESEQAINEIRGVEEQAVSGDILDEARELRGTVNNVADRISDRLEGNAETVTDHYEAHSAIVEDSTRKFVCRECLEERLSDIDGELDLVSEILSSETGSFGIALSDHDLDKIPVDGEGTFTEQIKADVKDNIPILNEELKRAYNTLPDLGRDGDYCLKHESVETTAVSRDGHLFSEVWRSLYYRFRGPIMDSVEDLEREAEEIRQNKEQKMIDLAQYEQIKDAAERDYHSIEAEHETARTIERRI